MTEITLEQVYRAASQLRPEEQEALIARLRAARRTQAYLEPSLGLWIFDVGSWPEESTLRREDEYGDEDR